MRPTILARWWLRISAATLVASLQLGALVSAEVLHFSDDFEGGLEQWHRVGPHAIKIRDSGDPAYAGVLELRPDEVVYALMKGSHRWGSVRVEADFMFPEPGHSYLGFIYHYVDGERTDFGSIYLKGNGSYLRANPRRDGNVSRLLYEEYRTNISGDDAVVPGTWSRLVAEVHGNTCHIYIGDTSTPKLTFDLYERSSGRIGFEPRVVGAPVWIDNIRVVSIGSLTYNGPAIPNIAYDADQLLTNWEYAGPFAAPVRELEGDPARSPRGKRRAWKPFMADRRGAVVTGRVTEYFGGRPVAYFRTAIESDSDREAMLHISSTDEIALFVNGVFEGFVYRDGYVSGDNDWNAWYDFVSNPKHAGSEFPIQLRAGKNVVMMRVRNGQFASGGFFAHIASPQTPSAN